MQEKIKNTKKQKKIRMCIFCRKRISQEELYRVFFCANNPYLKYKNKTLEIFSQKLENKKLDHNKTRSFYFCRDCWQNANPNYKIKQINYFLSKVKNIQNLNLSNFLEKINQSVNLI